MDGCIAAKRQRCQGEKRLAKAREGATGVVFEGVAASSRGGWGAGNFHTVPAHRERGGRAGKPGALPSPRELAAANPFKRPAQSLYESILQRAPPRQDGRNERRGALRHNLDPHAPRFVPPPYGHASEGVRLCSFEGFDHNRACLRIKYFPRPVADAIGFARDHHVNPQIVSAWIVGRVGGVVIKRSQGACAQVSQRGRVR